MTKLSSEQWSNYWQKGTVTTFHESFNNNYDAEIKSHWYKIFSQLGNHEKVVDLATGNGALLYLLDEFAVDNDVTFKAYGVDFAKISENSIEFKNCNIQFKQNTLIEKTGLEKKSIDCAISQYGIEYSDFRRSIKELDRIMKTEASISFIMHTHDSQIVKEGFQSIYQIDLVNRKLKINDIIKSILPAIEQLKKTGKTKYKIKANKLRNKLNRAMSEVMIFAKSIHDPSYIQYYYENALSVFRGDVLKGYSLQQKLQLIKLIESETSNLRQRMEDLTSVAMTEESNLILVELLRKAKFKNVKIKTFFYNKINIGQVLTAQRG